MHKPGETSRVEQTSPEQSAGEPAPPRVDTTVPQRVAQRINAPYTRVGTHKITAPTIIYSHTTI